MKGIMIQGTASSSGKTFITAGLCRLLKDSGLNICPFKSQNMSNNSYVTHDGREIAIAQAVQARAARLTPEAFMNPILLKPKHNCSSEIILNGQVYAPTTHGYRQFTQTAGIQAVRASLAHIARNFDAVIIEGAGSPAEINLNDSEIVNMRIAREADVPVILVADVDRGGSLAAVAGTLALLGDDRQRINGIIYNKFRGDIELFKSAVTWTENYTGVKVIGVLPFLENVCLPAEDSLNLHEHISESKRAINIGVLKIPGISILSDLEPLTQESDVNLTFIDSNVKCLYIYDALILPGTKTTIAAKKWLCETKIDSFLQNYTGHIFGICGGLQLMGRELLDPLLVENDSITHTQGLGLLPISTKFEREKITRRHSGKISGFEIHYGRTSYNYDDSFAPLFTIDGKAEGIKSNDMRLAATYLHGVFENDDFRAQWLNSIRRAKNYGTRTITDTRTVLDEALDVIADSLRNHLDIPEIMRLIHREGTMPPRG